MKKINLLLLLLLTINLAYAAEIDYLSKEWVMDISLGSSIKIVPELESESYLLDYVQTDLTIFPRNDERQSVLSLETKPKAEQKPDNFIFLWDEPLGKELSYRVDARVKTLNMLFKVGNKISFPISSLDDKYAIYTKPSKNIDSGNGGIIGLASDLAEGEDDLYPVVFNIAKWVRNNVKYSLDTSTEEVSQPASWVLNSRYGVCDEITSLFIALLRSVGIPAKYISGVAYTNYNNLNDFGPHAWAEVYFPSYGWVPFDITYDQFGFVDLSHIKLKESVDSDEASSLFKWQGRNVDIEGAKLDIKTELVETTGKIDPFIALSARAVKENINFGSYNLIEATAENLHNYYLPLNLDVSRTKELEIIGDSNKEILLKPFESKKVYWTIKVQEGLQDDYTYTFPVAVYTARNVTAITRFNSNINEPLFSMEDINAIAKQNIEEDEKTYSKNIDITCRLDKDSFYDYEQGKVGCSLKNTGNTFLNDLSVCLADDCKTINLGISQENAVEFSITEETAGKKEKDIIAGNNDVSKRYTIRYEVLDEPVIAIESLDYPLNVSFEEGFSIKFMLRKKSYSTPVDVKIKLAQNSFVREWSSEELAQDGEYNINLKGSDLSAGVNVFNVVVEYKDKNNKEYKTQSNFSIALNKPSFSQKLMIWLNDFGRWLEGLIR